MKIIHSIIGFLNLAYLAAAIHYIFSWDAPWYWMLSPFFLAAAVFGWMKFRKADTWRALRYANIACLIPAGVMLFLFRYTIPVRLAGEPMPSPLHMECMRICGNLTDDLMRNCFDNCTK